MYAERFLAAKKAQEEAQARKETEKVESNSVAESDDTAQCKCKNCKTPCAKKFLQMK